MAARFLLAFLLCYSVDFVFSLEPNASFEQFGREQGLSSSSVTAIAQDEDGFLWMATQGGLDRWDGYRMKVWQQEPFEKNTINHNVVQTLFLDKDGVVWLGTYAGLNRLDTKTGQVLSFVHSTAPGSLSFNVVTRIYRDRLERLWVATLDGLNLMDEKKGTFQIFRSLEKQPSTLSQSTVRALAEDKEGRLWVGTGGGLDVWDDEQKLFHRAEYLFPGRLPAGAVMTILTLPGDTGLWLGIWGKGLVHFDPRNGETEVYPLSDNRVFGLSSGENDEIHAATWGGGLVVFDARLKTSYTLRHEADQPASLSYDVVYGTFLDRSGILWVATNGGGLDRYNSRKKQFHHLTAFDKGTPPLPLGRVDVLTQNPQGLLWAGVYNGGLVLLDPHRGPLRVFRNNPDDETSLSNDIINDLTIDPAGRLWVSTNDGVDLLNEKTGAFRRFFPDPEDPSSPTDNVVNSINIDPKGRFWIGTYREGVLVRPPLDQEGPWKRYSVDALRKNSLPNNLVYFIRRDREGRTWVGTNGGLALYRPETDDFRVWNYDINNTQSLPSDSVRAFFEDSRGRHWIGTNGGGLSQIDPEKGTFRNWGRRQGLTNLAVFAIQEDDKGTLWVSTADGLFSFLPDKEQFRRYGIEDGLNSTEFLTGSTKTKEGELFLGTLKGITSFTPGQFQVNTMAPNVRITNLQVLNQDRNPTGELSLAWWENSLTIEFAALDFVSSAKNRYLFKMEGFDKDWINPGNRNFATYTNLSPGNYTFLVRGSNSDDVWSQDDAKMVIRVEASPWMSWYAYLIYFGIAGVVLYLFQKARLGRRLRQKVAELETVRQQLVEANHRLDQLSRLDGLTGISNRRALDSWLDEEWARSLRQKQSLAVLMLDIDFFKRYNDFYGHLEGDSCLKAVAAVIETCLHRTTDFCARYGGEEFLVVLHDTERHGAEKVGRRILESVDGLAIPHKMSTTAAFVTLSIGVAVQIPTPDTPPSALVLKADQALYRAKAQGRHCLAFDSP